MKKYNTTVLAAIIISICLSVISVIARVLLTNNFLDIHGVYLRGTPLPFIYHIALAMAIIALAVVLIIYGRKNIGTTLVSGGDLTTFFSSASAFLLAANIFVFLYSAAINGLTLSILDILIMAAAVPTIVFFLILAFKKNRRTAPIAILSFFPAIWAALSVMKLYFDTTRLMNDPDKILGEFALLSAMLFFLMEARNQVGIPLKGWYIAAATVTPILLFSASVPNLVCAEKLGGDRAATIRYIVYIALAAFILTRALSYAGTVFSDVADNDPK